ncbi:hypothetical protein GCM10011609_85390 [Lentzea pudingi]|uniref:Uncharacterized protein n=1 Tax=Lentzea pudingi TaxID=1789439 RepID=A0ABQ2IUV6_9PSEU|nr:hypothetical protein GCM10011609_85390 [Lentzea pudingi]
MPCPVTFSVGLLTGAQQLLFVRSAVAGIENSGADQLRGAVIARLHSRRHQYRQPCPVGGLELQCETPASPCIASVGAMWVS